MDRFAINAGRIEELPEPGIDAIWCGARPLRIGVNYQLEFGRWLRLSLSPATCREVFSSFFRNVIARRSIWRRNMPRRQRTILNLCSSSLIDGPLLGPRFRGNSTGLWGVTERRCCFYALGRGPDCINAMLIDTNTTLSKASLLPFAIRR